MPTEFIAVKCKHCESLLNKDTHEYLIVQTGLVVSKHYGPAPWRKTAPYIKTGEIAISTDDVFCAVTCLISAIQAQSRKQE